jgi:hypothetical protein
VKSASSSRHGEAVVPIFIDRGAPTATSARRRQRHQRTVSVRDGPSQARRKNPKPDADYFRNGRTAARRDKFQKPTFGRLEKLVVLRADG